MRAIGTRLTVMFVCLCVLVLGGSGTAFARWVPPGNQSAVSNPTAALVISAVLGPGQN